MKRFIKSSETPYTKDDYRADLLLLKHSHDPNQTALIQERLRDFKAKNPELAEKIKAEVNTPRPKAKPYRSKYRW